LKSKLIDYYGADVFVLCQRHFEDDDYRLALFNTNLKHAELYDKPNPLDYFGEESNISIPSDKVANWNNPGNSQIYINNHKMSKIISQVVDDYDYYILLRMDIQVLFNFPDPEIFKHITPGIHAFSCPFFDLFGGIGLANFVHKNFILEYLTAPYELIIDKLARSEIQAINLNQENFCKMALQRKGMLVKNIKGLNYFYTADGVDSYTTWGKPQVHGIYHVVYKYRDQVDYAFNCYKTWLNGSHWEIQNDYIVLSQGYPSLNVRNLLSRITNKYL
jgi:hypothetical protein